MKKIIFSILVIILALSWRNQPQKPSQEKQKPVITKSPELKTESVTKVDLKNVGNLAIPDYQCEEKTLCSQMNSCKEAKFYLQNCRLKRLDKDKDGIPCEGRWCFHKPNKQ